VLGAVLDLVLPVDCGGCGVPATRWCGACAAAMRVRADEPHLFTPRLDPGVPVFALGRYAGPRRRAVVALKEHGRRDLAAPLAQALAAGLERMLGWGVLGRPITVVPAPTRRAAARRRGGDPVARIAAAAAAGAGLGFAPVLRTAGPARDSVGLGVAGRERNIAGRVRMAGPLTGEVVLVDDIVTTGATAREAVRALACGGAAVSAVLTVAHA